MLKKGLHIVFSVVMTLLVVFGNISKEYLHSFTGHEDTVHLHDDDGELHFENEHHHCDFLAFTLPHYISDANSPVINTSVITVSYYFPQYTEQVILRSVPHLFLRGPPLLSA